MKTLLLTLAIFTIAFTSAIAQDKFHWTITNGPTYDYLVSAAEAPNGDLYVFSRQHRLFRQAAGVWSEVPVPPSIQAVSILITRSSDIVFRSYSGVIDRMHTDGTGWANLNITGVTSLVGDRDGGLLGIFNQDSIATSTDQGSTWTFLKSHPNKEVLTSITRDDAGALFVSTSTGLYKSSDNGNSWKRNLTVGTGTFNGVYAGHGGMIILRAVDSVRCSMNSGASWKVVAFVDEPHEPPGDPAISFDNRWVFPDHAVEYFERDSMIRGASMNADCNIAVRDSTSGWIVAGSFPTDVRAIPLATADDSVKSVVFKYYPGSRVSRLLASKLGIFAEGDWSFISNNGGNTWGHITDATPLGLCGGKLIGVVATQPVRSLDSGKSWTPLVTTLPATNAVVVHGDTIYAASNGVYRSTDQGATWVETNDNGLAGVQLLAMDSSGYLYAWTDTNLYRSTPGGDNWNVVRLPFSGHAKSLRANLTGQVAVTDGVSICRSEDHGATWEIHLNWKIGGISDLYELPNGDIFTATNSGVGYIPAHSSGYYDASLGLVNLSVYSLAMDTDGTMYAGTGGSGVWKSSGDRSLLSVASQSVGNLETVVWPNPASTTVSVATNGFPKIVDMLGRECEIHWQRGAGVQVADLSGTSPGIYYVLVAEDGRVKTSRLSVLRK